MKILIFEYITGGGMRRESVPAELAREGEAMVRALLDDLSAAADGIALTVLRDDRFPPFAADVRLAHLWVCAEDDFASLWRRALAVCDAVWPIAPETSGILERVCRDAEEAGKILLNGSSRAVRLAGDKLATLSRLAERGLPVVPAEPWRAGVYASGHVWVVKPNDGVGCEGARVLADPGAFAPPDEATEWIVQPLIEGEALSLSALFAHGRARLLSVNRQRVARAGDGFKLCGCAVNALADEDGAWTALVEAIACALPELWGYAGVDLILTPTGPRLLEINPRLTVSYAGLRAATGQNPAAMTLALARSGVLPHPPRARRGKIIEIRLENDP